MNSLEWLTRLVAFDTTSRNSNLNLIQFVKEWLASHGIASQLTHDPSEPKANLFATIPAKNGNKNGGLVLSGHTDVVPVDGQDWHSNPFELLQKDDKLFGRGTCDMKGFIAVALSLVPEFLQQKLSFPIHLALSYDEEIGCRGAPLMIADFDVKPKACIVGEPTEMRPVIAHKGIQVFRCSVQGCAAHSSLTTQGCNAIEYAAQIICYIRALAEQFKTHGARDAHFDVPFSTLTTNLIKGGNAYNTIPALCEFIFELRNLPSDQPRQVIQQIEHFIEKDILPKMQKEFSPAKVVLDNIAVAPSFDSAYEADLAKLAREVSGEEAVLKVAYATEAGLFQNADIPTIICGPGSIEQAHRADEFVTLAQLKLCGEFLRGVVKQF